MGAIAKWFVVWYFGWTATAMSLSYAGNGRLTRLAKLPGHHVSGSYLDAASVGYGELLENAPD